MVREPTGALSPSAIPISPSPATTAHVEGTQSAQDGERAATNAQKNKLNHRQAWPYGNYRAYYSFRPASSASADSPAPPADALEGRLALLDPSLFRDKRLLDLGTNSGKIPLDALKHLGLARATGVDIDPLLIVDAKVQAKEQGYEAEDPRLDFLTGNFMHDGWFSTFEQERGQHQFDVISLFSVTKWLHLHHGDEGMQRLFRALYDFLPVGGIVVVEPQEWDNYKSAVKKNKDLREVFKAIKMRPPFEEEMKEVGFVLETRIEREEGGFSRPLLIWRKEG
ncbi:hypothetical protein JCM8547_002143 [Rhodosporidiobolus lusitaniae]